MRDVKSRIFALALAGITMISTAATAAPTFADANAEENATSVESSVPETETSEITENANSNSVDVEAQTKAVLSIAVANAGGNVIVNEGSEDQETIAVDENGKTIITDAHGTQSEAAVTAQDPYAVKMTVDQGTVISVKAEANDGYEVGTYSVTFDGGTDNTGFQKSTEFTYKITVDKDKKVQVGFEETATEQEVEGTSETVASSEEKPQESSEAVNSSSAKAEESTDNKTNDKEEKTDDSELTPETYYLMTDPSSNRFGVRRIAAGTNKISVIKDKGYNYRYYGGTLAQHRSTDGDSLYCLERESDSSNGTYSLDSTYWNNSKVKSAVAYVLGNGQNNVNATTQNSKYSTGSAYYDYAVTQMAVWGILDKYGVKIQHAATIGGGNAGFSINYRELTTGHGVKDKATALFNDAVAYADAHPNSTTYRTPECTITAPSNTKMKMSGNVWATDAYTLTSQYGAAPDASLSGDVPAGARIEKISNTSNGYTFRVVMNNSDVEKLTRSYSFDITAGTQQSEYQARMYRSGRGQAVSHALSVSVTNSNPAKASASIEPTGRFELGKKSENTNITENNSCYSLKDAKFEIFRDAACTNSTGITFTTDEDGKTGEITLVAGKYYVKEIDAPLGYFRTEAPVQITVSANTETNFDFLEIPANDPVDLLLVKQDAATGKAQGKATLKDAEYTVKYYPLYSDTDPAESGNTPRYTWVFKTDENGRMFFTENYKVSGDDLPSINGAYGLPLGTITLQETKAPEGYLLNDQVYVAETTMTGEVVKTTNLPNSDTLNAKESVIRGDLNFIKWNNEGNAPLAGIPFVITSMTTGESHVIVSDAKGHVNTAAYKHSNNTNANDSLVEKNADGGWVCTDESKLDAEAGIWFGGETVSDDRGALPYDTYTIEEVSCSANYGKNIHSEKWNVSGLVIDTNGKNVTVDPEVWDNKTINIETIANNGDTDTKAIPFSQNAFVTDKVKFENLTPGDTYTIKGKLVVKNTDEKGNLTAGDVVAEAQSTFTPDKANGTTTIDFHFDASKLEGKTLVAYEYVYWKGVERQKHEDIDDKDQTTYIPELHTYLTDTATGDQVSKVQKDDTLVDRVEYKNLALDETYEIEGQLIDKATGKPLEGVDKQTKTIKLTNHDERDGSVEITFPHIDTREFANKTVVAYETLYLIKEDGSRYELNRHENLNDKNQSVFYPEINTSAKDGQTMDHVGTNGQTTVVDSVNLKNLMPGKEYTVSGVLMSKETGQAVLVDGKTITAQTTFTFDENGTAQPTGQGSNAQGTVNENGSVDGTVDLTFTLDSSVLEGQTVVVFEDLIHNGQTVDFHHDIQDEGQSVHYPEIRTTAVSDPSQDDVGTVQEKTSITDTVILTNLVPGMEYTINGTLHNQKSGAVFTDENGDPVSQSAVIKVAKDGSTITSEGGEKVTVTQTGNSVNGTVDLVFTFDSSLLSGQTLVAFEDLEHNKITVATHSDIHDKNQSVHYPEIHTVAVDTTTGDHVGTIWGALINEIRKLFGDKDADGNGIPDETQQNITDTVILNNLVPGRSYAVSGKLMNAEDGKPVVIDGNEITASTVITVSENGIMATNGCETTFDNYDDTNNDVDGTVKLTFVLDSSKIQGVKTVAFERLYHADGFTKDTKVPTWDDTKTLVNKHEDTSDDNQSVSEVSIKTTAVDSATGDTQGMVPGSGDQTSIIEDTVNLAKLVPGAEYQITGRLVDLTDSDFANGVVMYLSQDGTATEDINQAITVSSNPFIAAEASETHELEFSISSSLVQGKDITVFEDLLHNGVVVSRHPAKDTPESWDKEAFKSQTVHYPTGKTNATDKKDQLHQAMAEKQVEIVDDVYFENLIIGNDYTITGRLHYQDDFTDADGNEHTKGEVLKDADGNDITTTVNFTAAEDIANAHDVTVSESMDGTKTVSGYLPITITIDGSALEGATLVAEEDFEHQNVTIFTHYDLNDTPQTVKIPKIRTTANVGEIDESAVTDENGNYKDVTIVDSVNYENLWTEDELKEMSESGKNILDGDSRKVYDIDEDAHYIVKGVLMDKETGEPLMNEKGEIYVSYSDVFTAAESGKGSVNVNFVVNAGDFVQDAKETSELEGKTIVVFETLYRADSVENIKEDRPIAEHKDIEDNEQDIRFPKGRTHALDGIKNNLTQEELSQLTQDKLEELNENHDAELTLTDHEIEAEAAMKIVDYVTYENLHAETEYTVTGTLQVVTESDENGKAVKWEAAVNDEGNPITKTVTFTTPAAEDGSDSVSGIVPILFEFSGETLAGKTVVTFETFQRKGQDVIVHANINDTPQADYIPNIRTHATDAVTGTHEGLKSDTSYVIDRISYENLQSGKTYSISAQLMDKADGSPVDGTAVTGMFVAGKDGQFITKDGTVISTLDDVRTKLEEKSKLAVQTEDNENKDTDPTDNTDTGITQVDGETTVTVGKDIKAGTYRVTANEWIEGKWGYIHVFLGEPKDDLSNILYTASGAGKTFVTLAEGQTVRLYNVNMKMVDAMEGFEAADPDADTDALIADAKTDLKKVNDAVKVEEETDSIIPENTDTSDAAEDEITDDNEDKEETKEYDSVIDTNIGEVITTGSVTGRVSGDVYVVIPVDSSKLGGHTVVAFEKLFADDENGNPKEIAHHEDLEDADQSVTYPELKTIATVNGSHSATVSSNTKLTDTVTYKGLTPGQTYRLKAVLMDKATGKEALVNGKQITAEAEFKPEKADGQTEVIFSLNSTSLAGKTVVAFETMTTTNPENGEEITVGEHKDINDADQSVKFTPAPAGKIQTGDTPVWPFAVGAAAALAVIALIAFLMKKSKKTK